MLNAKPPRRNQQSRQPTTIVVETRTPRQKQPQRAPQRQRSSNSANPKSTPNNRAIRLPSNNKSAWTPQSIVPRNLLRRSPKDLFAQYIRCLLNAHTCAARYPDSEPRATALWRSTVNYDIPFSVTAGSSSPFSFAIQPIPGDVSSPNTYQLAIVNPAVATFTNTDDYSAAGTYISNINGRDPRVDINAPFLLSPPLDLWATRFTFTATYLATYSYFANTVVAGVAITPKSQTYRLTVPAVATANNTVGFQALRLPVGNWLIILEFAITPSETAAAGYQWQTDAAVSTVTSSTSISNNAVPTTATIPTTVSATYAVVAAAGAQVWAPRLWNLTTGVISAIPTAASMTISVAPCSFGNTPFPASAGIVEQIRPVACCALATCMAPELVNGGSIAAAFVPEDYIASNFFTNSNTAGGQAQQYANLANVPGAYNGPFRDGAYVWWSPLDVSSMAFRPVANTNNMWFPGIIMSGVFAPISNVSVTSGVLRLQVDFVFEYVTASSAVAAESAMGSMALVDAANSFIQGRMRQHAMANATHKNAISAALSGIDEFLSDNPWLMPLVKTVGTAALALI